MLTAILSFVKGKIFSEAGSFILPLVGILTVFLIWNSETILTKFGFATTTNLKSEITQLKSDIAKLEEANSKLVQDLSKAETKCSIVTTSTESLCETKKETSTKVTNVIDKRKEESERIKKEYSLQPLLPVAVPAPLPDQIKVSSTEVKEKIITVEVEKTKPASLVQSTSRVDRLSMNNIKSINEAYDNLFGEK